MNDGSVWFCCKVKYLLWCSPASLFYCMVSVTVTKTRSVPLLVCCPMHMVMLQDPVNYETAGFWIHAFQNGRHLKFIK
jgi:hypothetical protein